MSTFVPPQAVILTSAVPNFNSANTFGLASAVTVTASDLNTATGVFLAVNNTILTSNEDDFINAGAGDDIVVARAGDDTVAGGLGDDSIFGGAGDDDIAGGFGDDFILGGALSSPRPPATVSSPARATTMSSPAPALMKSSSLLVRMVLLTARKTPVAVFKSEAE